MKRLLLIALLLSVGFSQQLAKVVETYENGNIKSITSHKETRNRIEKVKYVEYYENGQKEKENTYKNGIPNGKWTEWHNNGEKSIEGTYKDGKVNGKWTRWADDGSLTIQLTLQDGKISDSEINAFKSLFIINGRFDCFDGSKSIVTSWVNDNECDCSDCSDEPLMKR